VALGQLTCTQPAAGSFGVYGDLYLNSFAGFIAGAPVAERARRLLPARPLGDEAHASDALDKTLAYDVEGTAPNRLRRSQTQDRRELPRDFQSWKVEGFLPGMHNFGRLVTRWKYHIENFLGQVELACLHLLLRHL